nr:MAG TPA: TIP39 peptide [Caudoviricetes sp.]
MINHRFKITMFLCMLTYAQKWLNSYVFTLSLCTAISWQIKFLPLNCP